MGIPFTALLVLAVSLLATSWYLAPVTWTRVLRWLARKAAGLGSRHLRLNGIHWHYLQGGSGPWLVLLHGFGGDADHWLSIARRLRFRFRIIAPDLVGFGASDSGAGLPFDIASQASRLADFLDAAGVGKCIVGGNSMGGWIAAAYAATHPGRVHALWLLAPLGVRDCQKSALLSAIDRDHDHPLKISTREQFEARVSRQMFHRQPWIPYPMRVYYSDRAIRRSARAVEMFEQVRHHSTPIDALAPALPMPVLIQWGKSDRAVDVSGAERLAQAFPAAEVAIHDEVGHLPMLEAAGQSARLFLAFASRHGLDRDDDP